ncbi:MAG: DUF1926 domain-containing protein [candidate division Zixibacteria bacterium]|nr:DUF1926 domain-containing protein [candidate division Zixibacteria bacterium]MDH3937601.1 DUF1926 domain-containing protein [candidate division Zixibacteria bacterium]MDH4034514.1 DUF1926 domain-containing protein [candidate division Zixibacteria bacterium]
MAKFRLALGLHNHQPVGNFEAVFEEAHQKAYLPFLKLATEHPSIRFSLHQSGILWRWQKLAHADYFQLVGNMVDQGQIELMTGGFYEPILTAVPERDALGQIKELTSYLHDHFEVAPSGLWLTERIWEPHLPKLLAAAGVSYLPIDDTHFLYAGFEPNQLGGPFVTENEGHTVTLLPIQKRLRYLLPFGTVEDVIEELKVQAERNSSGLAIYADDGEKFGVWPKTFRHCYEEEWLRRLFEAIEKNSDWLEVITLGEAAALEPVGRAYLPSASYSEMLHWALPSTAFVEYERLETWLEDQGQLERYGRFVRGGHWRGFLSKYEESNLMHKKMLSVSNKLAEFERLNPGKTELADNARDRLYAGQCNCPYWHGVFGGLYLPHIRQAVYESLIEADVTLDQLMDLQPTNFSVYDYDADGVDEVMLQSGTFTAVFKPGRGGLLLDLALNKHNYCITDTLTRRREGYHLKLDRAITNASEDVTASIHDVVMAKEEGLKNFLNEDWYLKRCFIDHFMTDDVDFDKFLAGKYGEEGDFILEPYAVETDRSSSKVSLVRQGHLWRPLNVVPVTVQKQFTFAPNSDQIEIRYQLSSRSKEPVTATFALENNFSFQAGHAEDRTILINKRQLINSYLDSTGRHEHERSWAMIDQYRSLAVALDSDQECELWHAPIFTVSLSEGGFEKVYQGTTFVNVYRLQLGEQPVEINLTLYAGDLAKFEAGLKTMSAAGSP